MSFKCTVCGQIHEGPPDLGFQWPDYYFGVPEAEREKRIKGDTDVCVIDSEDYFIRGVLFIPVPDFDRDYGLGVWVSQKKENFETYIDNYDTSEIGPFFGWLSNCIPFFELDTLNLQTMVHFQGNGQLPLIKLEPCDHPLYEACSNGFTLHEVSELVAEHGGA